MMKTWTITLASIILLTGQAQAQVYPTSVVGEVADITATYQGLLIRMENNAQPSACTNPHGWMLIPNSSQILAAVVLSYWSAGKKSATVYTDGATPSMCTVTQYDPPD